MRTTNLQMTKFCWLCYIPTMVLYNRTIKDHESKHFNHSAYEAKQIIEITQLYPTQVNKVQCCFAAETSLNLFIGNLGNQANTWDLNLKDGFSHHLKMDDLQAFSAWDQIFTQYGTTNSRRVNSFLEVHRVTKTGCSFSKSSLIQLPYYSIGVVHQQWKSLGSQYPWSVSTRSLLLPVVLMNKVTPWTSKLWTHLFQRTT